MSEGAPAKRVVDPRFQQAIDLINLAVHLAGDENGALDILVMATSELVVAETSLCDALMEHQSEVDARTNFSR
jgi:hypothetical protein